MLSTHRPHCSHTAAAPQQLHNHAPLLLRVPALVNSTRSLLQQHHCSAHPLAPLHLGTQQQQCPQPQWQQQQSISPRGLLVLTAAAGKGFGSPSKTKGGGSSSKARRKCPCGSGQAYEACCGRYISGSALAPTPEALLRSRFSAYALQQVDYLVKTTHRQNPEFTGSNKSYARTLKATAAGVEYLQLDIEGPVELQQLPQAYAKQHLLQSGSNASSSGGSSSDSSGESQAAAAAAAEGAAVDAFLKFSVKFRPREGGGPEQVVQEISHFRRVDGEWLYFNEVDV